MLLRLPVLIAALVSYSAHAQDSQICLDAGIYLDAPHSRSVTTTPYGTTKWNDQNTKARKYSLTFTYQKTLRPVFSHKGIEFRPIIGGGVHHGTANTAVTTRNGQTGTTTVNTGAGMTGGSATTGAGMIGGSTTTGGGMTGGSTLQMNSSSVQTAHFGQKQTEFRPFVQGGFQLKQGPIGLGVLANIGVACQKGTIRTTTQAQNDIYFSNGVGWQYVAEGESMVESTFKSGITTDICPFGDVAVNKSGTVNVRVSYTFRAPGANNINMISPPFQVGVTCKLNGKQ